MSRSASVRPIISDKQVQTGGFCNTTAVEYVELRAGGSRDVATAAHNVLGGEGQHDESRSCENVNRLASDCAGKSCVNASATRKVTRCGVAVVATGEATRCEVAVVATVSDESTGGDKEGSADVDGGLYEKVIGRSRLRRAPAMVSKWTKPKFRGFAASKLRQAKGVYNWRRASPAVMQAMLMFAQCVQACADVPLEGRSSVSVKRELRDRLVRSLSEGKKEKAFAKQCGCSAAPRVDELEELLRSYPGWDSVDWDEKPVRSGLNVDLWKLLHAEHCDKCTGQHIHRDCYFRLLFHFLNCGFTPPVKSGCDLQSARSTKRAYVDKWRHEQRRCETAFAKWVNEAEGLMSQATGDQPAAFFPLLPVTREKDKWRRDKHGTEYKVRLCLDLKQGGMNDMLEEWPFRFWGLDCVAENVQQGDWLASIDLSRFYLRLPAGRKLRAAQWFQDPESYAKTTNGNERLDPAKMRFRQLLSVAFGLKSAPAYASAVSMEAVRILRSKGIDVVGVYIDDILIRGKTEAQCKQALERACAILASLGIPTNEKVQGPCAPEEGIVFLGVKIRTDTCSMSVTKEYRAYALDRVIEVLQRKSVSLKVLESVGGILAWVAHVFVPGKPRRNVIFRTIARMKDTGMASAPLAGPLRQQLQWWVSALRLRVGPSSFFWARQPDTPLMVSDASGEDGWGACVLGLHIVGPWPHGWEQSTGTGPSMLVKELVPQAVAMLLLARWAPGVVFAAATDNAGVAFVMNKMCCKCPLALELLRPVADAMEQYHLGLLGGHAHRCHNRHADDLSHALTASLWNDIVAQERVHKRGRLELPFVVADVQSGEAFAATISFKRPSSLRARHAQP